MGVWDPWSLRGQFRAIPAIPGVGTLSSEPQRDHRGMLRKPLGIHPGSTLQVSEVFWSVSHTGVVRGMHTGSSGHQGDKLVTVMAGEILDAVVDLRPGPTLGVSIELSLNTESPSLLVPAGVAHGFQVLSKEAATVLYVTSNPYEPQYDTGVDPRTCGVRWPLGDAIVSDRDRALPSLQEVIAGGGWAVNDCV
jgi:dTDP-4-dehydrorhamnose 3,5-epimerase